MDALSELIILSASAAACCDGLVYGHGPMEPAHRRAQRLIEELMELQLPADGRALWRASVMLCQAIVAYVEAADAEARQHWEAIIVALVGVVRIEHTALSSQRLAAREVAA